MQSFSGRPPSHVTSSSSICTISIASPSAQGKRRRGEEIIVCSRWISDITKNRCRRGIETADKGITPKFFPAPPRRRRARQADTPAHHGLRPQRLLHAADVPAREPRRRGHRPLRRRANTPTTRTRAGSAASGPRAAARRSTSSRARRSRSSATPSRCRSCGARTGPSCWPRSRAARASASRT